MNSDLYFLGLHAKLYLAVSVLLVLCFGLSHFSRWHWICDLLSHFMVQYAFFAFVFFFIFIVLKMPLLSLAMFVVGLLAGYETRLPLSQPWHFFPTPRIDTERNILRVVQYNKYYDNKNYAPIAAWLNNTDEPFDVVFLLEVEPEDAKALRSLTAETYPFTLPAEGLGPDFSIILSRHKVLSYEERKIAPHRVRTRGVRFEIQPEGYQQPVVFFGFHTRVPILAKGQAHRNAEMNGMAEWVASDPSPYKIAVGDWNITPYSPYFSDFAKNSGMAYQTYGGFPPSTWVSFFTVPVFKIPIDHMLYGKGFNLTDLKIGPAFGSDHHSLTGSFVLSND